MIAITRDERSTFNRRFEISLDDGSFVEAVLYRTHTLCVSSQVGCAVACPFCASGAHGLARNLNASELMAQVDVVSERLEKECAPPIERITVSGVGEPLHNHDAVARFVDAARARRLPASLTTSGGTIARLREWLCDRPHHGLTLSVHAGTEAVRARMVPRGPDLASMFALLHAVLPTLTRARRKKTALAYLALSQINESDDEIDAFVARARPLGLFVHLYAHNTVETSDARGVTRERYEAMHARMTAGGLRVRMSSQARIESNGGCGTLVALRRRA